MKEEHKEKKRYDVVVFSQGKDGKNYGRNIGVAFVNDNDTINIITPVYANMTLIPPDFKKKQEEENGVIE